MSRGIFDIQLPSRLRSFLPSSHRTQLTVTFAVGQWTFLEKAGELHFPKRTKNREYVQQKKWQKAVKLTHNCVELTKIESSMYMYHIGTCMRWMPGVVLITLTFYLYRRCAPWQTNGIHTKRENRKKCTFFIKSASLLFSTSILVSNSLPETC